MRRTRHGGTAVRRFVFLGVSVSLWLVFVAVAGAQRSRVTAFVGATVVDGTGAPPIADGVVLTTGATITAVGPAARVSVPPGARRLELAGRTILPGFVNVRARMPITGRADVHAQLLLYARYGVTSVFSAAMPDDGPGRARLFATRPPVDATTLDEAKARLGTGVDLLSRGVLDRPVDFEFVQLARSRDACVASTLTREMSAFVYETTPSFFRDAFFLRHADRTAVARLGNREYQDAVRNDPATPRARAAFEQASRNLKQLHDARVRIAMGTDSGGPTRFPGSFEHLELELLVRAGLTPGEAIVAATGDAARCMKKAGAIGTIQPGAFADLVVYDRNPLADIRNTHRIESVWIGGVAVDSAQ